MAAICRISAAQYQRRLIVAERTAALTFWGKVDILHPQPGKT